MADGKIEFISEDDPVTMSVKFHMSMLMNVVANASVIVSDTWDNNLYLLVTSRTRERERDGLLDYPLHMLKTNCNRNQISINTQYS